MAGASMPVPVALEVQGQPLSAAHLGLLTSMRVETAVNLVGRLVLRFADAGYQLSTADSFGIGKAIAVKATSGEGVLFHGTVSSIALDHSSGHVPELVVTAEEPTAKLANDTSPRDFRNQTAAAMLSTLVSNAGLTAQVSGTSLGDQVHDYTLKVGSSLTHLDQTVRKHNAMWWFQAPNKVRIGPVAAIDPAPVRISLPEPDRTSPDQTLLTFSVKATGSPPRKTVVSGWDPEKKQRLVGQSTTSVATESQFVQAARKAGHDTSAQLTTNAGTPGTKAEADTVADAIHTSLQSDAVTGRGTAIADPRIRPGVLVEIAGVGPASGRYLVTAVEHVYDRRGFHTSFRTGSHRPRGLVDTLGGLARPETRIDGVLVGIVTAVANDNAENPAERGKVKVKLPAVLGDELESAWARVATFDAGNGRGATFLPELDDEVLVAFEDGNLRRPVVLGSVFGGINKQPELGRIVSQGAVNTRRLTSRTGHALEMVDERGKSSVLLQHGKKEMSIKLDEESNSLVIEAKNGDLKLTNGQATVTLAKNGDITIEGMAISVKAKGNHSIDAKGNADLKATGNATVEGVNTTLKGQGQMTVQGGGVTTVKGGTVMIN